MTRLPVKKKMVCSMKITVSGVIMGKILIRNVTRHLRDRIFKGVMKQKPVRFSSRNTADYLSALVNDVKLVEENYLLPLLLCFQMIVLFLATLGILFYLSPLVTVILLGFLVLFVCSACAYGEKAPGAAGCLFRAAFCVHSGSKGFS